MSSVPLGYKIQSSTGKITKAPPWPIGTKNLQFPLSDSLTDTLQITKFSFTHQLEGGLVPQVPPRDAPAL